MGFQSLSTGIRSKASSTHVPPLRVCFNGELKFSQWSRCQYLCGVNALLHWLAYCIPRLSFPCKPPTQGYVPRARPRGRLDQAEIHHGGLHLSNACLRSATSVLNTRPGVMKRLGGLSSTVCRPVNRLMGSAPAGITYTHLHPTAPGCQTTGDPNAQLGLRLLGKSRSFENPGVDSL